MCCFQLITNNLCVVFTIPATFFVCWNNHKVVEFESKISEANNPRCSLRNRGKGKWPAATTPKRVEHINLR